MKYRRFFSDPKDPKGPPQLPWYELSILALIAWWILTIMNLDVGE